MCSSVVLEHNMHNKEQAKRQLYNNLWISEFPNATFPHVKSNMGTFRFFIFSRRNAGVYLLLAVNRYIFSGHHWKWSPSHLGSRAWKFKKICIKTTTRKARARNSNPPRPDPQIVSPSPPRTGESEARTHPKRKAGSKGGQDLAQPCGRSRTPAAERFAPTKHISII